MSGHTLECYMARLALWVPVRVKCGVGLTIVLPEHTLEVVLTMEGVCCTAGGYRQATPV